MPYHTEWVISRTGILMVMSEEAIKVFQSYVQDDPSKLEAGGILLGHRRRNHFDVLHVTEPTKFDERSRYHWIRSEMIHADIANRHWTESSGRIMYLGEWHTHPETLPEPSETDYKEWKALSTRCNYPGGLAMIIVGIQDLWCGVIQRQETTAMNKIS